MIRVGPALKEKFEHASHLITALFIRNGNIQWGDCLVHSRHCNLLTPRTFEKERGGGGHPGPLRRKDGVGGGVNFAP